MTINHIPFIVAQELRPTMSNFLYFQAVFTLVECKKIVELGKSKILEPSKLRDGSFLAEKRNSSNSWIENDHDSNWIYHRLNSVVEESNREFRYDLSYFGEPLQFTQYETGQYYGWHTDVSHGSLSIRKLTLVVNLTDPRAYTGGDFQIFSTIGEKIPNELGSVLVFPSFKEHRLCPIKSGTRNSLVAWISGPPFR